VGCKRRKLRARAAGGRPFNDAAQQMGRRQAQTVSSAANGRIIAQLGYKLAGAIEIDESYTSQTCPVCGERSKHQRTYRCPKCGLVAPRDVVGCLNIRTKGMQDRLLSGQRVPLVIKYKYPGKFPGSSGGHPASCSQRVTEARSPLL
jgi:transposase